MQRLFVELELGHLVLGVERVRLDQPWFEHRFAGAGLDLSSHAAILAGSHGPDGKPRSIFTPLPDGTPRIVAHLLARHAEVAGAAPELRGMPLGLTPVPLPDIALLATWISQGRKP